MMNQPELTLETDYGPVKLVFSNQHDIYATGFIRFHGSSIYLGETLVQKDGAWESDTFLARFQNLESKEEIKDHVLARVNETLKDNPILQEAEKWDAFAGLDHARRSLRGAQQAVARCQMYYDAAVERAQRLGVA